MNKTTKNAPETTAADTCRCFDPVSGKLVYELAVNDENAALIEMLRADDESVRKQNNWVKNHITQSKPTDLETGEALPDDQNLAFLDWTYSPEFVLFASDEPESFDVQTLDKLCALRAAVKQLTVPQQTLIHQFFGKQMTMPQIAQLEENNCSKQAIFNRIAKIQSRLRKLME